MQIEINKQTLERLDYESIKKWNNLPFHNYFYNMGIFPKGVDRICQFKIKDGYEIISVSFNKHLLKDPKFDKKTNTLSFIHRFTKIPDNVFNLLEKEEDTYVYSIGVDVVVKGFKEPIQLEAFAQIRKFDPMYSDYGKQYLK